MYMTMKEMHIRQMAERHEQGELDYAFREIKAMRRSMALKTQCQDR